MSDCRLSREEGFVESVKDEVEVRAEEYTLRGGQESYRRLISITVVPQRRNWSGSRYRCSSKALYVALFGMERVSRQAMDGEQVVNELGNETEQSEGGSQGIFAY